MSKPIGPRLNFDEGLNPRIGDTLFAKSSSISAIGFICSPVVYTLDNALCLHSLSDF